MSSQQVDELRLRVDNLERLLSTTSARHLQEKWDGATFDTGDTAWMLAATALILFMTMPGLILYYAGMVSSKNVLAIAMQIFSICCLITFEWLAFGYSLAFTPVYTTNKGNPVYGNGDRLWLRGMELNSFHVLCPSTPEALFCAYQLCFAIILFTCV